jgi:hypothetical protein
VLSYTTKRNDFVAALCCCVCTKQHFSYLGGFSVQVVVKMQKSLLKANFPSSSSRVFESRR